MAKSKMPFGKKGTKKPGKKTCIETQVFFLTNDGLHVFDGKEIKHFGERVYL